MKNYGAFIIIAILISLIYWEYRPEKSLTESVITTEAATTESIKQVDNTASFVIFTHNSFRYFNNPRYHNLSKDVYVEGVSPNIVHVKKSGISWGDFFKTLPMKLTDDCLTTGTGQIYCTGQGGTLKFYINGEEVQTITERLIQNGDRLLVSFGYETGDQIRTQIEQLKTIQPL